MRIAYSFLFILIFVSFVSASGYTADVIFDISSNGELRISGNSNHPKLENQLTQNYTYKNKEFWLINFTTDDLLEEYLFELKFPENAVVNYIKTPNILSINQENDRIIIFGTAKNKELKIIAQYSFIKQDSGSSNYFIWIIILLVLILVYYIKNKEKKTVYNTDSLTDRQKQIFDLIVKNKGSVNQSYLQKQIDIPKASLSRNIDALIRKRLVVKESKGMTNLISLKK